MSMFSSSDSSRLSNQPGERQVTVVFTGESLGNMEKGKWKFPSNEQYTNLQTLQILKQNEERILSKHGI